MRTSRTEQAKAKQWDESCWWMYSYQLTRTPLTASSSASAFVIDTIAPCAQAALSLLFNILHLWFNRELLQVQVEGRHEVVRVEETREGTEESAPSTSSTRSSRVRRAKPLDSPCSQCCPSSAAAAATSTAHTERAQWCMHFTQE